MKELFKSRNIFDTDNRIESFVFGDVTWDFKWWWSRYYEYCWMIDCVKEYFPDIKEQKLSAIDFATGHKHPGAFMLENLGFDYVTGVDLFSESDWQYRNMQNDTVKYRQGDICDINLKPVDCVVCISTLEHIGDISDYVEKQERALNNMIDHLNDGGCLILTFDMPGYRGIKTDVEHYYRILDDRGMSYERSLESGNLITSFGNDEASPTARKNNDSLTTYRMFAYKG